MILERSVASVKGSVLGNVHSYTFTSSFLCATVKGSLRTFDTSSSQVGRQAARSYRRAGSPQASMFPCVTPLQSIRASPLSPPASAAQSESFARRPSPAPPTLLPSSPTCPVLRSRCTGPFLPSSRGAHPHGEARPRLRQYSPIIPCETFHPPSHQPRRMAFKQARFDFALVHQALALCAGSACRLKAGFLAHTSVCLARQVHLVLARSAGDALRM